MRTNSFGKRLNLMLKVLNISQRDLAQKSGLTESAISHYIKGDRIPNASTIIAITDSTGVCPNWLLGYGSSEQIERM